MKTISINGHILSRPLLVDDPDVKRAVPDASGELRHVRSFSQPGKLRNYLKRHPEGIILAGTGTLFFIEPVPVSASMISFDELRGVRISIKEKEQQIENQLSAMESIWEAASNPLLHRG